MNTLTPSYPLPTARRRAASLKQVLRQRLADWAVSLRAMARPRAFSHIVRADTLARTF